jgi:hypoxanthine phosphoribosyltransferase
MDRLDSSSIEILISADVIAKRIDELADAISLEFKGKQLYVIAVLNGAFSFAADVVRRLKIPVYIDFVGLSSYRDGTEAALVRFTKFPKFCVEGKSLLLIDDILDSGRSLATLVDEFRKRRPAVLKTCVLLNKLGRRALPIVPDYCGFTVENHFVVGYGLDNSEQYRQLPFIGYISHADSPVTWESFKLCEG